ncbi:MAG: NAD+ synthase [Gammaproteobacteria bacterium]|nr:NAD+ synthase [Gammaproteobacteria bacterium]
MQKTVRVVMAQVNLLVGDLKGNAEQVIQTATRARDELKADLVIFPELTLTGYPPEDLLLRPGFHMQVLRALEQVRHEVRGIDMVLGYPNQTADGTFNSAALIQEGEISAIYNKQHLPNYSVFDERRYFTHGSNACVVNIKGVPVGLTVCEDIWSPEPVRQAVEAGARLIINLNASPFHLAKENEREEAVRQRIEECGVPVIYVNLVGGQDELVFDGASFVMNGEGKVTRRCPAFEEGLFSTEFEVNNTGVLPVAGECVTPLSIEQSAYKALVLGVKDYVDKNGFQGVVIGLSGGIDSALTLAVAVDALGKDRVEAVSMPSRYTADMSIDDARQEAEALGIEFRVIPIETVFKAFLESLKEEFAGTDPDTTEENIQARCRGVLLMAISNKKHKIVLTTGNKSEMAVGYATLYGDMAGGFDVLKDVPKTLVVRLAKYRNSISPVIPERVIERPPSAELAPDQKDEDSLPAYEVLDPILEMYVEQDKSVDDIIAAGFDQETVKRVIWMVDRNEYKRRQAPPGVRITRRAFGRDRRYPITSGFGEFVDR